MQRLLVLSDLHLGQRGADAGPNRGTESLLASPRPHGRRRLDWLASEVARFAAGGTVHLVVTGDLLDLSLATLPCALEDLGNLLRALPAVTELTWVPGNHDHHAWTLHSERRHVLDPLSAAELPHAVPYQRTPRSGEPCTFVEPWLRRAAGRDLTVRLAYPSFEIDLPDGDRRRRLYFIHGDLFGGFYMQLAALLAEPFAARARAAGEPLDRERIAATVNGPVLEFVYWQLGAIGEGLGVDGLLEQLYADLRRGSESVLRKLLGREADLMTPKRRGLFDSVERGIAERVLLALAGRLLGDENGPDQPASRARSKDRHAPLPRTREALRRWIELTHLADRETLLFHGHTHVADRFRFPDLPVEAINPGAWLVEPGQGAPHAYLAEIEAEEGRPLSLRLLFGGADPARESVPANMAEITRSFP